MLSSTKGAVMPIRQISRIKTPTKEQVAQAFELQSEGASLQTLANLLGLCKHSLENILWLARRYGFEVFERKIVEEVNCR